LQISAAVNNELLLLLSLVSSIEWPQSYTRKALEIIQLSMEITEDHL